MHLDLGIIGHRNLRLGDLTAIRSALHTWGLLVEKRFPNRNKVLWTSLAPGADQLCAWVLTKDLATSLPHPIELFPVFPYDTAAYLKEMRQQEKTYHFEACEWSISKLADNPEKGRAERLNPGWTHPTPEKAYEACYREAGRCLADKVDILIALWDGVYSGETGGTSDTLLYALSSACQEARKAAGRPTLEVHWLVVPRESNPHPAGEAFSWQPLTVQSPAAETALEAPKHFVRTAQYVVPLVLGAATVASSVAGYWANLAASPEVAAWMRADKVLTAISHLALNALDSPIQGPGASLLRLGRWLALGFVLSTIAGVMSAFFRWADGFALWRVGSRPHDLVCGLGWRGRGFIADSARDRPPIIAVELSPDEATRAACHRIGVPLVEGDATSPETLRKVGVSKVQCAFIACNDDETNMQAVHQLARMGHSHDIICCVELHSDERFQILQNALPSAHPLDLRILNAESVTSRMLLEAHPLDRFAASPDAPGAEVILVGDSSMAEELLRQVLQQGIYEDNKKLAVSWVCSNAAAACRTFMARFPAYEDGAQPAAGGPWIARPNGVWLAEKVLPEVRLFDLPRSGRALIELFEGVHLPAGGPWVTTVFIATSDPAESASRTYALAPRLEQIRRTRERDITVWCYYNTPEDSYRSDIENALNRDFQLLPVRVFSDFMGAFSRSVVRGDGIDRVARRVHGLWRQGEEERAQPGFDKVCVELWRAASEDDKDSSRQAAAHARVKQRIRARLRAKGGADDLIYTTLAVIEHRRWCAEKLLKGFRPLTRIPSLEQEFSHTPLEDQELGEWFKKGKDGEKKRKAFKSARRHADLIPFGAFGRLFPEEIAAVEAKKDMDQVNSLDLLLGEDRRGRP